MKLLTILIPCYNSERFIVDCLNGLLIDRDEELDVIVINDGSKDKTSELAHAFAAEHPFVRVVDKENGGHGSGINKGLELAEGLFFKVLDSDDHLEKEGLIHLLETVKRHQKEGHLPDLYLADYYSCRVGTNGRLRQSLKQKLDKVEEFASWKDFGHFNTTEFIMIHMAYPRTQFLRDTGMRLLEKVYYEDNQFDFHLIEHVREFYYLSPPIYLYSVGVEGQSVSLAGMDRNFESNAKVIEHIIASFSYEDYRRMERARRWHIDHEFYILLVTIYFYTYIIPTEAKKQRYKQILRQFHREKPRLYRRVRLLTPARYLWICPPFLRALSAKIGYEKVGTKNGWK